MKKNATRVYILLAAVLVVFSAIAFAIPFAKTASYWIAYGFGVFAIAFQLYIFRLSFSNDGDARSRFYGFPIARVGVCYLIAQLIASVVEMALAAVTSPAIPMVVNVLLTALAIVGCVTTSAMRDEIARQDGQLKKNVANMRELQSLSRTMVGQCQDAELKVMLEKLADEFRYSDPVSSEATREIEQDMRSQLDGIQQALVEGDVDGAKELYGKLNGCLVERNRVCSVNK